MPPHCLAPPERSFSDGEVEDSSSPARDNDSDYGDNEFEHQWNSFEIRTLFCLIIKGEHQDRNGLLAPLDLASKLNKALNPEPLAGSKVSAEKEAQRFARDIPPYEVAAMLRRVLDKKRHAVDVVSRCPARTVTRRQLVAFTRQLDFRGDEEEWALTNRREHVQRVDRVLRYREEKEKDGRRMSPERVADNRERLEEVEDDRAQRLLKDWGIGHEFYEGEFLLLTLT